MFIKTIVMKYNRFLLHTSFWILYFSITLFNEIFLTSGFASEIDGEIALRTFISEFVLLTLKICFTYSVLYSFLSQWLKSNSRTRKSLLFLFILLAYVVFFRMVIQFITWPLIMHYEPQLSLQSQLARFFYSLLDILQILGIAVTIKLLRLRISNSLLERDYMKEKMNSDISRLKAQIHPHFLFNMLNNIYSLSKTNPPKTSEVIHQMSALLRFMLYESEKKLVTLESELQVIKDYVEIQQFRFGDKIRVELSIQTDNLQTAITPLLLFPLIENSFKHGVGAKSDGSYIIFSLTLKNGLLHLLLKNSIVQHSVTSSAGEGIGQLNIKKQLAILYKDYTFDYGEKNNEYVINLSINLNSYIDFELLNN